MMSNFDEFNDTKAAEAPVAEKKKVSHSNLSELKKEYAKHLAQTNGAEERRGSLSQALEITKVLGYGDDNGNIIVDRAHLAQTNERKLKGVSKIVGYNVKNTSNAVIKLLTEEYQENNGTYVGTQVVKEVAPGETIALARKYFALNGIRPEFGETFANGFLVLRTKNSLKDTDINEILESASFRYSDSSIRVHDAAVKIQIGDKRSGSWVVTDPYKTTFGFLMNEVVKTPKARGSKKSEGTGVSDIEAKAFEIFNLLNGQA